MVGVLPVRVHGRAVCYLDLFPWLVARRHRRHSSDLYVYWPDGSTRPIYLCGWCGFLEGVWQ